MIIYQVFCDIDYEANRVEGTFFKHEDAKACAEAAHKKSGLAHKLVYWDENILYLRGVSWMRYTIRQITIQ